LRDGNSHKGFSLAMLAGMVLVAPRVHSHHSFAAEFDYDAMGTIEGEVIEVLFVNPHARYFVSVTNADGSESIWDTQTRSLSALTRIGWDKSTIELGDRVKLSGNLGLNGARKLWIREVVTRDGVVVRPDAEPQ
jgi:Family of unknown function (DUF6152)